MDTETLDRLRELAKERKEQGKLRDAAQIKYDEAGDEIGMLMTLHDLKKADLGDYGISVSDVAGRETIQRHLLLEQGVTLEQIAAATKRGPWISHGR